MQLPTNYKMGTGLAAAMMGQQTGLEQEKMGLENLYKGMQMPGEILKGEEQAMLLQDPRYLQQKTANTMIELGNQFDSSQIQQSLNAFGRVKLQLQAAAGDPQKTNQIVMENLKVMGVDPSSDFGRAAIANPEQTIDRMIQGAEASLARTGGAKFQGEMAKQKASDVAAMERTQAQIQGHHADAAMRLGQENKAIQRARGTWMLQGPEKVVQVAGMALTTDTDPFSGEPLSAAQRNQYAAAYSEAQATLEGKGGGGVQITSQGVSVQPKGARKIPGRTGSNDLSGSASAFAPTNNDPLGIR